MSLVRFLFGSFVWIRRRRRLRRRRPQKALAEISDDEFERHKTALAVRRLEKPKQLSHRAMRYWGEITAGEYFFDRDQVEVDELKRIGHNDLLDFLRQFIFGQAEKRRKISVHVLSNMLQDKAAVNDASASVAASAAETGDPSGTVEPAAWAAQSISADNTQLVDDIASFKCSLPLYPLVRARNVGCIASAATRAKL